MNDSTVEELTIDQARALFDNAARESLGISTNQPTKEPTMNQPKPPLPLHTWTVRLKGEELEPRTIDAAYYSDNDSHHFVIFKDTDHKIIYSAAKTEVLDMRRN
jgi:hypothetical protein